LRLERDNAWHSTNPLSAQGEHSLARLPFAQIGKCHNLPWRGLKEQHLQLFNRGDRLLVPGSDHIAADLELVAI
jgi:hypothetical protein